jgi:hypothetical protein
MEVDWIEKELVLPSGYCRWVCDVCTASCNFEAMQMCASARLSDEECGFERDQPESLGGAFEFIVKKTT